MRVPLLDLQPQLADVREPLEAAVLEVVASGHYVNGPKVEAFEAEFAAHVGTRHAVGVSSGTDALLLALGWVAGSNFETLQTWVGTYTYAAVGVMVVVIAVFLWRTLRTPPRESDTSD